MRVVSDVGSDYLGRCYIIVSCLLRSIEKLSDCHERRP